MRPIRLIATGEYNSIHKIIARLINNRKFFRFYCATKLKVRFQIRAQSDSYVSSGPLMTSRSFVVHDSLPLDNQRTCSSCQSFSQPSGLIRCRPALCADTSLGSTRCIICHKTRFSGFHTKLLNQAVTAPNKKRKI